MIDYQTSKTDPLSDVVALLKPQAVAWRIIEAHDAWRIRFPATELVVFGQMIEGQCRIERADGARLAFAAGDFLLMAAPASWIAQTSDGLAPVAFEAVIAAPECLLSAAAHPTVTRFIAGAFAFAAPESALLRGLFPPMIHIRGADIVAGRLSALLHHLGDEATAGRPGGPLILDRLLDIILVEVLRSRHADFAGAPGLLAGLADTRISVALQLMHNDVRRAWTVGELARGAGMSRSSFAARFAQTVGAPPIDYLSQWRMTMAKAALASGKQPMADVARLAGYQSVSAFSTAFSRAAGCSPTAYVAGRKQNTFVSAVAAPSGGTRA